MDWIKFNIIAVHLTIVFILTLLLGFNSAATAVKSLQSNSVRPHRRQPTRLPCRWDSVGKNTGVGCHFLLQCMKVKSESEVAQSCLTLCNPMDYRPPGSSVHGIFQARVLEWVAIAFSGILILENAKGWFKVKNETHVTSLSRLWYLSLQRSAVCFVVQSPSHVQLSATT